MDLNSIFKFGSKADVLIRAYKAQKIGNITLQEGEPFIKIDNVTVDFSYSKEETTSRAQGQNLLTDNAETIARLRIDGVPLNERVTSLLYTYQSNQQLKTQYEVVECEEHKLILKYDNNQEVFVYDANKNLITTLTSAGKILEDNRFIDGESYIVFYKHIQEGLNFALKSPHIANLTLEIFGVGNTDETNSSVYVKLKRCSLNSSAKSTIDFKNTTNTVSLTFLVLDGKNTEDNTFLIG